jgi:membrane protease YdiL (CAAX protease family)
MAQSPPDTLAQLAGAWWLLGTAALCLPVSIAVFWRIGKWWITDRPVPLPLDRAWPAIPWPAWVAAAVFAGNMVAAGVIIEAYAAAAHAGLLPWEPLDVPPMFSPGVFLAQVLPSLALLALLRAYARGGPGMAGVRWGRAGTGAILGLVAFAAILPVCVAAQVVGIALLRLTGVPEVTHTLLETVARRREPLVLAVAIVQACVLAPLAEEFIYRGAIMMTLLKQFGPAVAMAASSAVFAAVHVTLEPQGVLPLFFLGMALAYVAYRTRSLVAPVIGHALFNALMLTGVFVSGGP